MGMRSRRMAYKGSWSRAHTHQLSLFQHAEASLSLKNHRGGFGDGIEDGGQVRPRVSRCATATRVSRRCCRFSAS